MYKFIIFILILCSCSELFAQDLSKIKHIEVVSEIQDSMILLNKNDVDKINKIFFEKKKLDSLRSLDSKKIKLLEIKNYKLDSIISIQNKVIYNNDLAIKELSNNLENQTQYYNNKIKKDRIEKTCWQTSTGVCILGIILLAVLL